MDCSITDLEAGSSDEDNSKLATVDDGEDCTIFAGIRYLGAAGINAPKSGIEIQHNMKLLNDENRKQGVKVSVSIPSSSKGAVILYDDLTNTVISRYEVEKILFYTRGINDSNEASCFAFTWSHGDNEENAIFQCHVFKCDISEAVSRVSACFSRAFQRTSPPINSNMLSSMISNNTDNRTSCDSNTLMFVFELSLEIKEPDGKGNFSTVQKDVNGFRLHPNVLKQLHICIKQLSDIGTKLCIERCFGVLAALGRHVPHPEMRLLEMEEAPFSIGSSSSGTINNVEKNHTTLWAQLDPAEATFEALNMETPRDCKQYMSVAVDLVIKGIREPVRFLLEVLIQILSSNDRYFWTLRRKTFIQQFYLNVKQVLSSDLADTHYEVLNMETSEELDRSLLNLNLNLSNLINTQYNSMPNDSSTKCETYSDEDDDEPLLSGTGSVSKDCPEDILVNWAEVLAQTVGGPKQRPKQLERLVLRGIPEALRGEVWQRLIGIEADDQNMDKYRLFITQNCTVENVIQRDIARTFPAHDFFKEIGGLGQDSLFRMMKAYAVYDTEVGYCQGLSFLAATMLLHMPEEQAFCVLIKLMYDYKLRDVYKNGFDNLYLRLYQLSRLLEEQMSTLWQHFTQHKIETHMFASQWFLTLFTARFPLCFVFHIIDIVLLQGIDTIFQIAVGLLMFCKKELLPLDFEGMLKYFRVTLPRKCRNENAIKQILKLSLGVKLKKLNKYELDFNALKDGWEIITSDSEAVNHPTDHTESNQIAQFETLIARYDEDRKLLIDENHKLKDMLKRETNKADEDKKSSQHIIDEYKSIMGKIETQLQSVRNEYYNLKKAISECDNCSALIATKQDPDPFDRSRSNNEETVNECIKELELQLAQVKVAHVEAECKNQDLTHQLRAIEMELSSTKRTWPPWLNKTLSSIKEVASKKDLNSILPNQTFSPSTATRTTRQPQSTFISHVDPLTKISSRENISRKVSDSQSCGNISMQ